MPGRLLRPGPCVLLTDTGEPITVRLPPFGFKLTGEGGLITSGLVFPGRLWRSKRGCIKTDKTNKIGTLSNRMNRVSLSIRFLSPPCL